MFWKVFRMDMKRGFSGWKFIAVVMISALLLFASSWDVFMNSLDSIRQGGKYHAGAIEFLQYAMTFDSFKAVIVLLFSGIYTGSFCQEENTNYLRMILSRTDAVVYTRSKFLANLILILMASLAACGVCCLIYMGFGYPIVSENAESSMLMAVYYIGIVREAPIVYIVMIGLQLGMVTALCSSVGLVLSSYQSNIFVSIGSSGFLFMILMFLPWLNGTVFDVLNLLSMNAVLPSGLETPYMLSFAWGMLWPLTGVVICCVLFERRMNWRAENGIV